MPQAITCPLRAAMRVERVKFLVTPQTMERRMRPPSSGKPGTRLKVARPKLICASHVPTPLSMVASGVEIASR